MKIRPAGMTYERALQIAIECDRREQFRKRPALEPVPHGRVLSAADREFILSSSDTAQQLAVTLRVSERQVQRVRARAAADAEWAAAERRRRYRESFRMMTEVWA